MKNNNELNVLDNSFYENIYNNLMIYIVNFKNNSKEEHYFLKNIYQIINLIFIESPSLFIYSDFLRTIIMIVFNYIKSPFKLNIEFISLIFNSFYEIIKHSKNKIIDKEINSFEKNINETIIICIRKFISNYDMKLNKYENLKNDMNFKELIQYIDNIKINNKIKIPLYLKGFLKYYEQKREKKYITIKIYKFLKITNSFKDINKMFISRIFFIFNY